MVKIALLIRYTEEILHYGLFEVLKVTYFFENFAGQLLADMW